MIHSFWRWIIGQALAEPEEVIYERITNDEKLNERARDGSHADRMTRLASMWGDSHPTPDVYRWHSTSEFDPPTKWPWEH